MELIEVRSQLIDVLALLLLESRFGWCEVK